MKKTIAITCFLCAAWAVNAQIWLTQDKTLYFGNKTVADTCNLGRPGWWNMSGQWLLDWRTNNNEVFMMELNNSEASISSTQPFVFGDDQYDTDIYACVYTHNGTPSGPSGPQDRGSIISTLRPVTTEVDGRTAYALDLASIEAACPEAVQTLPGGQKVYNYTKILSLVTAEAEALKQRIATQSEELAGLKQTRTTSPLSCENGTVSYALPAGARTACVQLCDPSGRQIRVIPAAGSGSIMLTGDDLPAGEGYASLVVDGTLVDTQKITLK